MAGSRSEVGRQVHGMNFEDRRVVITNVFAGKATGTLAKRASSLGLYARWYREHIGLEVNFPPAEDVAYTYVEYLRLSRAPPTRAQGFVEALRFCLGTLGADLDEDVLSSKRLVGSVSRSYEAKRITKKAPPVPAAVVVALEEFVLSKGDPLKRNLAGFILMLIFTRARCRDLSRIKKEPVVDAGVGNDGFIETMAERVKGTRGAKKARLGLPVVGPRLGLAAEPWADAWLRVRVEIGRDAGVDQALFPAIAPGGAPAVGVGIASGQLNYLARQLFEHLGVNGDFAVAFTSHSWTRRGL